jgi:Cu-Zn family superoxide dismutase
MRTLTTCTAIFAAVVVTASPAVASASAPNAAAQPVTVTGRFVPYQPGARAVTYNQQLVRAAAEVRVISRPTANGMTMTTLAVGGLVPNRVYGAHAHMAPCGQNPEAAGSHYQNVPDPVQPSVDPRYANPRNEIWLDFRTDARGNAQVVSTVPWQFTSRHAQSVVIHANQTATDPGHAGMAGDRLACVTVPF